MHGEKDIKMTRFVTLSLVCRYVLSLCMYNTIRKRNKNRQQ